MRAHMDEAKRTGMIRTILGRRSRFDLYEPAEFGLNKPPLPYSRAILEYGRVQRAGVHKGLNRRLQGSAADLIKMAMYRCWVDGVFAETGIPRLTVHDELDFSDPGGKEAAFKEMQHIMETAIPIKIPIRADGDIGPDWGHCTPIPV
jgi:DNA polymerase-1